MMVPKLVASLIIALTGLGISSRAQVGGASGPDGPSVAKRLWQAQNNLAYRGKRIYFFNFGKGAKIQEEFLAVRPNNQAGVDFHLELNRVLYQSGKAPDQALAKTLFARREGPNFFKRGFRIESIALAQKNYYLSVLGSERVAGRNCDICTVFPKNKDRRGWKLWVDQRSGLPLRSWEYSAKGILVSGVELLPGKELFIGGKVDFTDIKRWHSPSSGSKTFKTLPDAEKAFGYQALMPSYLPSGYMLSEIRTRLAPDKKTYLLLSYTDGIDFFTVINGKPETVGSSSEGADDTPVINRFQLGTMVQLWVKLKGRMIMVVGRMSMDEIPATFESILL